MNIDKSVKKAIDSDWLNVFPQWSLYNLNRYYKIIGPVLVGIELIRVRGGDEYRPYLVSYPLWKSDIEKCLDYPLTMEHFYNKKHLVISIKYEWHGKYFNDAVNDLKGQLPDILDGDIILKHLLVFFESYSTKPPLNGSANSQLQAELQAAKLSVALYTDGNEAQNILRQIKETDWDLQHFKACGTDIDKWLHELQDRINNREAFLRQIITNTNQKKLVKLKRSELIP